jgi:hypothetical protein
MRRGEGSEGRYDMTGNVTRMLVLLSAMVLTGGCVKDTKITSVERDEGFRGRLTGVLVIGAAEKDEVRRHFEDECVRLLGGRGIRAVASHTVIPRESMLDKDTVVAGVRELGLDSVLLTRVLGRQKKVEHVPPGELFSKSLFSTRHAVRGEYVQTETVELETVLYALATERAVWSATSEVFIFNRASLADVNVFIEVMMKSLLRADLLR